VKKTGSLSILKHLHTRRETLVTLLPQSESAQRENQFGFFYKNRCLKKLSLSLLGAWSATKKGFIGGAGSQGP
jgi:hypothetical protein